MMLSMAAFAIEDMFVKAAAKTVPIGLVLMLFGIGGTALLAETQKSELDFFKI